MDTVVEDSITIHKDVLEPIVITIPEDETVIGDSVTVQRMNEVLSLAEVQVWGKYYSYFSKSLLFRRMIIVN